MNPLQTWLPYRKARSNPEFRLFCFPHAGGAASVFRNWPDLLPPHIEVCAVQLPGREARLMEPAFTRMSALTAELTTILHPLLDRPFALFGYSLGAAIACETARAIARTHNLQPTHLYVCARRAPHLRSHCEPIHTLPEPAFKDKLRQLGGTPEEALNHPELLELILPLLRADFELNDTYLAQPAQELLACPIRAYGGVKDTEVSAEDLEAWKYTTTGPFHLKMFPGGHFFLKEDLPLILNDIARANAASCKLTPDG